MHVLANKSCRLRYFNARVQFALGPFQILDESLNVLPEDTHFEVCPDSVVRHTPISLAPFVKGVTVKPLGITTLDCVSEKKEHHKIEFFVCKDSHPLLGKHTSRDLGLVTRNINLAEKNNSMTLDDLKSRYDGQFRGLGKIGEPYKIHLKIHLKYQ